MCTPAQALLQQQFTARVCSPAEVSSLSSEEQGDLGAANRCKLFVTFRSEYSYISSKRLKASPLYNDHNSGLADETEQIHCPSHFTTTADTNTLSFTLHEQSRHKYTVLHTSRPRQTQIHCPSHFTTTADTNTLSFTLHEQGRHKYTVLHTSRPRQTQIHCPSHFTTTADTNTLPFTLHDHGTHKHTVLHTSRPRHTQTHCPSHFTTTAHTNTLPFTLHDHGRAVRQIR